MISNDKNNTFVLKDEELAYMLSFWIAWAFRKEFLEKDPTSSMIDIIVNEYKEVECADCELVIPRRVFICALACYYDSVEDYDKLKKLSALE